MKRLRIPALLIPAGVPSSGDVVAAATRAGEFSKVLDRLGSGGILGRVECGNAGEVRKVRSTC